MKRVFSEFLLTAKGAKKCTKDAKTFIYINSDFVS